MSTNPSVTSAASPLILDDLAGSGYAAALTSETEGWYYGMAAELTEAGQSALATGRHGHGRALVWLSDLCSMVLSPQTRAEPFSPYWRGADSRRTFHIDDLTPADLDLLAAFAPTVAHPQLRARMADLVWSTARRKSIQFALMAIDAYREVPTVETWHLSGQDCWHRALQLAMSIRDRQRVTDIEGTLIAAFRDAAGDTGNEAMIFLEPLYIENCATDEAGDLAEELGRIGAVRAAAGNLIQAELHYDAAARWFGRARLPARRAAMFADTARMFATRGDSDTRGAARQDWYTKAIAMFRAIEGRYKAEHDVDATVDALRTKMASAGRSAIDEMPSYELRFDFTKLAQEAITHVSGREALLTALNAFCSLAPLPSRARLFEEAAVVVTRGSIAMLGGSLTLASDGRQVARRKGAVSGETPDELMHDVVVDALLEEVNLIAHGLIVPALFTMHQEWNLSPRDFLQFTRRTPFVPEGRAELVAQGLHAGWHGDFIQALHILVPQFEHMVRIALKAHGAQTTTHDKDGLDTEVGLSTLVDRPQMVAAFGDDISLLIRSLLCEQRGPNLRNNIAHGLAGRGLFEGAQGIYFWWMLLRLIVQQYAYMDNTQSSKQLEGD